MQAGMRDGEDSGAEHDQYARGAEVGWGDEPCSKDLKS